MGVSIFERESAKQDNASRSVSVRNKILPAPGRSRASSGRTHHSHEQVFIFHDAPINRPQHLQVTCGAWTGSRRTPRPQGRLRLDATHTRRLLEGALQLEGLVPCLLALGWSRERRRYRSYRQTHPPRACQRMRELPMADHVGGLQGVSMAQTRCRCWRL